MVTGDITVCFTKPGKGDKGYSTTLIEKIQQWWWWGECSSIKIYDKAPSI